MGRKKSSINQIETVANESWNINTLYHSVKGIIPKKINIITIYDITMIQKSWYWTNVYIKVALLNIYSTSEHITHNFLGSLTMYLDW